MPWHRFRISIGIRHFPNLFRVSSRGCWLLATSIGRRVRELFLLALHSQHPEAARRSLQLLTSRVQSRELAEIRLQIVREAVGSGSGLGA